MAFNMNKSSTPPFRTDYPLGSEKPVLLDNHGRATREGFRERLDVDHEFTKDADSAIDGADIGKHKQVTLADPIATPTPGTSEGILYTKDAEEKAELHFCDEDGNEIQLTSGGAILLAGEYDQEVNLSNTANALAADSIVCTAEGLLTLPSDTTDTTEGNLRYNTTDDVLEFRDASAWKELAVYASLAHFKIGTYSGDGSANQGITGIGFEPAAVLVMSGGSHYAWYKDSNMGINAKCLGTQQYGDDAIISLDADGFTVGGATGLTGSNNNAAGVTYYYLALEVLS